MRIAPFEETPPFVVSFAFFDGAEGMGIRRHAQLGLWVAIVTLAAPARADNAPTFEDAPVATSEGRLVQLVTLGADDGPEDELIYTWSVVSGPQPVSFALNGNNAAKETTAVLPQVGDYVFKVVVRDAGGNVAEATVGLQVLSTLSTIQVIPPMVTAPPGSVQEFLALGLDPFGNATSPQPVFAWSSAGGGRIGADGKVTTKNSAAGPYRIEARSGDVVGVASLLLSPAVPPSIAQEATATALNKTSATLKVLGADDGGEATLKYYWTTVLGPAGVSISATGTHAASTTVATFSHAGRYRFQVTVVDATGAIAVSGVDYTVAPVLTKLAVAPSVAGVAPRKTFTFAGYAVDQFQEPMAKPALTWTVSGGGAISAQGLFTAAATAGGPFTVTAKSDALTATAEVSVVAGTAPTVAQPPAVELSLDSVGLTALGADDGGEPALTYTWERVVGPEEVSFDDNESNTAKVTTGLFEKVGTYVLSMSVTDAAGLSAHAEVEAKVTESWESLTISPTEAQVQTGGVQPFDIQGTDQFGLVKAISPTTVEWSLTGGGTLSRTGLYNAALLVGGPFKVKVTSAELEPEDSPEATVTIVPGVPIIDNEPPELAWISPAPGAKLKLTPVLEVSAVDNLGVKQVSFLVDGNPLETLLEPPWAVSLDTRLLRNGNHTLEVTAVDVSGNEARLLPLDVEVFNIAGPELKGVTGGTVCGAAGGEPALALLAFVLRLLPRRRAR